MFRSDRPTNMSIRSANDTVMNRAPSSPPPPRGGDNRFAAAGRPVKQRAAAERFAVELAQLGVAHRGEEGGLEPLLDLVQAGHVGQGQSGVLRVIHAALVEAGRDRSRLADEHRRHYVTQLV